MDILSMSLSASVMIVAVAIIRALTLHRLPKRSFLALWGVVLCRLLIPFSVPCSFSFYTGLKLVKQLLSAQTHVSVSLPAAVTGIKNTAYIPVVGKAVDDAVSVATPSALPVIIVWLTGMCACSLIFLIVYLKCYREFKTSLPARNDSTMRWLQEHELRRTVQIRQSDRIQAPLTYGVFRPVILLPKSINWTDEAGLKAILTHEFTHVRRFDSLAKLVLTAAVCVHWFNPLVWVMYALANRDIELACDEAVVRSLGESMKSAYALTLIRLAETKSTFAPLVNGFSRNAIEERITAIMKIKKRSFAGIMLAFALVIGTTAVFATNSAGAEEKNDNADSSAAAVPSPSAVADPVDTSDTVDTVDTADPVDTNAETWVWPAEGCPTVTSAFGKRVHPVDGTTTNSDHICISGKNADGAKVYAALTGTVSETGFADELGNYIAIDHDNGIKTIYRHLKEIAVSKGDSVAAGDTIGTVGKTGTATGPCLGFCVYVNDVAVNPLDYFDSTPK